MRDIDVVLAAVGRLVNAFIVTGVIITVITVTFIIMVIIENHDSINW